MITCLADGSVHESAAAMHKHLQHKLKLKQETYYTQYHPRVDMHSGAPIPFKNTDQYLAQDFVDKNSMNRFLKARPVEGLEWSKAWLARRKEEKALVFAPSEVELRTLFCPAMAFYKDYYATTAALGFQSRYTNEALSFAPIQSVIQDTREQSPIKLPYPTEVTTLNVGDYAAQPETTVRIERKSLQDMVGSLSDRTVSRVKTDTDTSFARFGRELERARDGGLYVVMVVEADINTAQSFNRLPHMKHSRIQPAHVFKNLRDLLVRYPLTFQAVFCKGRVEMARVMDKVFQMGEQARRVDLQWHYEQGTL